MLELSNYNLISEGKDSIIIFNTLYRTVIKLEKDYAKYFSHSLSEYPLDLFNFLKENKIIVDRVEELETLNKIKNIYLTNNCYRFVFFTTLKCNLRCSYCYQAHDDISLSKENYDDVLEFIKKIYAKNKDSYFSIEWFGGEPLLKLKDIKYFMSRLKNILPLDCFGSSITTNGVLLSEKVFEVCLNLGIKDYQITLDVPEINKGFRKTVEGKSSFDVIYSNLNNIKKNKDDFQIAIRVNIDKTISLDEIGEELEKNFGGDKRFPVLLFPISNWGDNLNAENIYSEKDFLEINGIFFNKYKKLINKELDELLNGNISCNLPNRNNFVINPKGKVTNCTINYDDDIFGDTKNLEEVLTLKNNFINCEESKCILYPICFGNICKKHNNRNCNNFITNEKILLSQAEYDN